MNINFKKYKPVIPVEKKNLIYSYNRINSNKINSNCSNYNCNCNNSIIALMYNGNYYFNCSNNNNILCFFYRT